MIAIRPDAVRAWRKERKLTQDGLAKKAGVSRVTVVRIENGEADSITFGTVNKLAKALEQDADQFVVFK